MNAQIYAQTTENHATTENGMQREKRDFTWVVEVLLLACVTPALVHGITSLSNLPIA